RERNLPPAVREAEKRERNQPRELRHDTPSFSERWNAAVAARSVCVGLRRFVALCCRNRPFRRGTPKPMAGQNTLPDRSIRREAGVLTRNFRHKTGSKTKMPCKFA